MRRYGLLGRHLSHSYSPQIHAAFGEEPYDLFEVEPDDLPAFLAEGPFDAINVTVPYKQAVLPHCTALSDRARQVGCVNTLLRFPHGSLFGDNTDCVGFAAMLVRSGVSVEGKKAVVLGSGGASRAVCCVLREKGAREIVVVSRSGKTHYGNLSEHADAELLINATPVGMYPDNGIAPVSLDAFPACRAVFDLIYHPARTALLLDAERRGIPSYNGLPMLIEQAIASASLFRGEAVRADPLALTEKLLRMTRNLVLIGMPGCGKTTVGRLIAARTGRHFVDTDEEIVSRVGTSIPAFFAESGEVAFRTLESEVLREAGKGSGQVIATGGGAVTVRENYPLLHQNGVIVFLDRAVGSLAVDGRPLSLASSPTALAEVRLPLYRAWADLTVDAADPAAAADEIISRLL